MTDDELVQHYKEKGRQLVQDDSCHWYLIPAGYKEDFYAWEEWMGNYCEGECPSELEYERFEIDGPESLTIFECH